MAAKHSKDSPLTDVHKRTLQRCHYDIVPNLEIRDLVDVCHRDEILTSSMIEEVMAEKTASERCRIFLRKLETRSIKAFNSFIEALKEHYDFLATMIEMRLREETLVQASINLELAFDIAPVDVEALEPNELSNMQTMLKNIEALAQKLIVKYNVEKKAAKADDKDGAFNGDEQTNKLHIDQVPERTDGTQREPFTSSDRMLLDVAQIKESKSIEENVLNFTRSIIVLSNGLYVMCGADAELNVYKKSYKTLLCDNQCNVLKTLVADKALCVATYADMVAVWTGYDNDTGRVRLFDIRGEPIRDILIPTIENPMAIAFNEHQELIIANHTDKTISHFNIITRNVTNTTPSGMFKAMVSIASINHNSILIADFEDASVKIINRKGDLLAFYRGEGDYNLKYPMSVCVDSAGYIIIADYGKHNIQLLSPEANFKKIIMSESDGIKYPSAVTLNNQGDLVIGTSKSANVYVVKYMV
ncbi:unnamed protein product [Owenia fusiformis]|uniref:Uncharacterized protein n=1 Tax=Owenia fusiformis TaxID=6347 RepID=A0A8J1UJ91_OWEFU|nr:unnamed protein product [Owenia fusiformis]